MNKDKKQQKLAITQRQSELLEANYRNELDTNVKYSLEVDPENKYNMSEAQKLFIKQYIDCKDLSVAAYMSGLDIEVAKAYYLAYSSQQEIRRINMAMYHRQFAAKLLSLDEIGGYLTSLLIDYNVASADRLKNGDKLKVAQMLIDLNKMKIDAMQNPDLIMNKNIDNQLKSLSIKTIQDLIYNDKKAHSKDFVAEVGMNSELTPEENAYLSTLDTSELLNLIETVNKKEDKK